MNLKGQRIQTDDIATGAVTAAKLATGLSPTVASLIFSDGTVQTTASNATNTNAAQAYQTTGQSIPNDTQTAVVFDTLSFSQSSPGIASMWDTAANTKLTAPVAGIYVIAASVFFEEGPTTGYAQLSILLNGSQYNAVSTMLFASSALVGLSAAAVIKMNAGDYVQAMVYQSSGSSASLDTGSSTDQWTSFYMSLQV